MSEYRAAFIERRTRFHSRGHDGNTPLLRTADEKPPTEEAMRFDSAPDRVAPLDDASRIRPSLRRSRLSPENPTPVEIGCEVGLCACTARG